MRSGRFKTLLVVMFFFFFNASSAQNFSFNCSRDTLVPGCPVGLCITLKAIIPDIHGLSTSYSINPGSFNSNCIAVYVAPDDPGGTSTNLTIDDKYSAIIPIGFSFPFYGTIYTDLVASTNGYISFDISLANGNSHWQNRGDLPNLLYDRALVMGPYHDLLPGAPTSPTQRIQYQTWGTTPNRRWVLSFYKVPLFSCTSLIQNTHQIILYESTGIIEVKIFDKQVCSGWNGGKSMVGIQDFSRTQGMTAPNRKMTDPSWGSVGMNETWRFVPDAGPSLLKRVELYDMGGALISTGTTAPLVAGCLEASFPNICAPAGTITSYIVKSVYEKIDDPTVEIFGTDTVRINRSNPLIATATPSPASCGVPDGSIIVTGVSGGTPPYEYSLDGISWFTSNIFTGLATGNYTVYIRDVGSVCLTNIPNVIVGVTGTITATTTATATSCISVDDGTITINSAGGTGPYTFILDGGAPVAGTIPYTFTNVAGGPHTIRVNDAGTGCTTGDLSVNVPVGVGVSGSASTTPTACVGVNTGTITVTALTGTPPFTWSLDGGAFVPGASPYTFTNVSAGGHNVVIRDINTCTILVTANVAFGTGVSGSGTTTATSCPSVNNGTITVTALTGTPPFTWSLDGGTSQSGASPYTFSGVTAGPHNVTIVDNLGCTILVPVNVAAGATPVATTTSTATACTGVNNGTITITSASGTGPYTFTLDGGPPQAGTVPFTFTNVTAGTHTVIVTDVNGCTTNPITETVATGIGVTGVTITSATSCPTASNGTATVTINTGTPPFTYVLDGGTPVTAGSPYTFTGMPAGLHTIVVTDNIGCSTIFLDFVVTAGPVFTANTSSTATSCSGAVNGTITVTPNGGVAPFTFSLDGGTPQTGTPPYTFNNVTAGAHAIVVTDGAGCITGSTPVTVAAGPLLSTTAVVNDVLCNGGNTGRITVTIPSIGTPPYEYSLNGSPWQSSNIFNGLTAGVYTVAYRESNGCQGQHNETINEPPAITSSASVTAVRCNGGNDGAITISAGGGVGPYQYSIDGGANWQSNNVFNVTRGAYSVIIRDANGCTTTQGASVTEPPVLTASSVTANASCNGGNDGSITVTAAGGNSGGYQYSIDGGPFQPSNIFNVGPGNYNITVKDNLGCTAALSAVVGLTSNLTFTPQTDPTICEGSSTSLNLISNATAWSWMPVTGLSNPAIANPVANPAVTTQYVVTATLDRCSTTDTVRVNVNPAPVPDAGPPGFICYGQDYQLQGSGGIKYLWTPSTYLDNPSLPDPVADATRTITYTLSVIADANGCPSLVTDAVTVDVTPPIKIYTFPADTIIYPGDRIQLKAVSTVPSANIFAWSPFFNISNANVDNPIVTGVSAGDSIVYKVTASSAAGCIGEAYVRVRVYKGPELYVPTAFTPNGDGLNDRFYPFPVGIKAINYFRVFNRWGQLIFFSNILYKGWDGKLQGVDQPAGVYVWMAQGIDKNNKPITRQGTITLIR